MFTLRPVIDRLHRSARHLPPTWSLRFGPCHLNAPQREAATDPNGQAEAAANGITGEQASFRPSGDEKDPQAMSRFCTDRHAADKLDLRIVPPDAFVSCLEGR